jgi:hypothetical protein
MQRDQYPSDRGVHGDHQPGPLTPDQDAVTGNQRRMSDEQTTHGQYDGRRRAGGERVEQPAHMPEPGPSISAATAYDTPPILILPLAIRYGTCSSFTRGRAISEGRHPGLSRLVRIARGPSVFGWGLARSW